MVGVGHIPSRVPRPPAYAWAWLQRSRPVVQALAQRLTGGPPSAGFVDELRAAFADDPFVQAVVVDTIADVAFAGRVPHRRPAGVQWDRGLSWWAAALAGVPPRTFDRPTPAAIEQVALFGSGPHSDAARGGRDAAATAGRVEERRDDATAAGAPRPSPVVTLERRRLANALRSLLAAADGDSVPAAAVRQLLHDLESGA